MKFIAKSISDFIISRLEELLEEPMTGAREMRIVLPSLPGGVVINVGKTIEEYCLGRSPEKIKFIYKVAYALGTEWQESNNPEEKAMFNQITEAKDWYDAENHLTQYRNIKRTSSEDVLAIVLVGYDRVTDRSSLSDFFCLDNATLWRQCLKNSFGGWLRERLDEKEVIAYEDDHVEQMDELLKTLVDISLADLVQISIFLENVDLNSAQDGRDALLMMVDKLDYFRLPCMRGLVTEKRKKRIAVYLSAAIEFFNYSMFLDGPKRKKTVGTIDKYMKKVLDDDAVESIDPDMLGSYETINDLIAGLKKYIETNNANERERLCSVDFVFLLDEILGFRPRKGKPSTKPKKLSGMPLEVVLRAVWLTLGEFKTWTQEQGLLAAEAITDIQIQGELFRHNCDGSNQSELDQKANRLLRQTIGGIDKYLEEHLSFAPDPRNNPDRNIRVASSLCPQLKESAMRYQWTSYAEPCLKFVITVAAGDQTVKKTFIWRFPQIHAYRNMAAMFGWIYEELSQGNSLPVFRIPYIEELVLAKDEDEVNRIMELALQSTSKRSYNLLKADGIDSSDKVVALLQTLASEYGRFIRNAHEEGVFAALTSFTSLQEAYGKAYQGFLRDPDCKHSQLGPFLFKAFFMLGERTEIQGTHWMWQQYEPSVIITPLHPALLEMMYHQHAYLCESFEVAARQALRQSSAKLFKERRWANIEDLARIQWPVHGTLQNAEQILDTNVRSFGIVHLVGEHPEQEATLTTRLLLRYDASEEEEVSDEDLFRETRESRLIQRVLQDYRSLHPHADDGIMAAAYCSGNVQSIIAGVDAFLNQVFRDRDKERIYTLSLTLFAESQDDTTVTKWINEWRERWQAAEQSRKFSYYNRCCISVAHRMVTREKDYAQFKSLVKQMDIDVAFLLHFIRAGSGGNRFMQIEPYDHRGRFRMFPVLEKSCCSVAGGGQETVRERIISNRQFVLGTLHSEVMAHLKHNTNPGAHEYVVMGRGDFAPWKNIVDTLHEHSAWVVCIDPSVDERLIAKENEHGVREREIIGFGSGVGAHGEHNYTVSTECFSMAEVKSRIASHVAAKLGPWDSQTSDKIAESVVKESLHMAGMSLVRATGPSQYIRDFIAYAVVRKLLLHDPTAFCDEVISLDAFKHWFDSAIDEKRPDLMRLKAVIKDGIFHIEAQLIECKLAQESDRHLEKAREQLENGLHHLISCFKPREGHKAEGLDDRPDQRYWWLQLHRLIASKGQVSQPQLIPSVGALERLSDGFFSIEWKAAAVTFWTDSDDDEIHRDGEWDFTYENASLPISKISAGRHFVRTVCTGEIQPLLPLGEAGLCLSNTTESSGVERELVDEGDQDKEDEQIKTGLPVKEDTGQELPESRNGESKSDSEFPGMSALQPPDRIFLGRGVHGKREVYWEFSHPELANRHMLVFGASGMGKTYAVQALMCELGRCGQNSLIVDYTNGFEDNQLDDTTNRLLKPTQHRVQLESVPLNPFRRQTMKFAGKVYPEKTVTTAQRVRDVFATVYELGDQQKAALYSAIRTGIEKYDNKMSMEYLFGLLQEIVEQKRGNQDSAASVMSKIQAFIDAEPFGEEDPESWEKFFSDTESRCHILQLAGSSKDFARLVTEFSLIDLYWYYRSRGNKDCPRVIVLDEVQNLDHRLESPLGQFLTEGRKFGIALILATQTLSNLGKDERDRLFQACHKLFFRPADTEMRDYSQILANATNERLELWIRRLSELKKGECYSLGPSLYIQNGKLETKAFRIRIDSLESRFSE